MSDLGDIESLRDRIARIEEMVKEIQGELGLEQKGSGLLGADDDEAGEDGLTDEPAKEAVERLQP